MYYNILKMIFSKKTILVAGVVCIGIFAFLNRIQLIVKSEVVVAQAEEYYGYYNLYYTYKGVSYKYWVEEKDVLLEDNTTYKLLIKNENPNDFTVLNFWGFYFLPLVLVFIISSAWLLLAQIFFEKIDNFKLSFGKEKEDEDETEKQ